MHRHFGIDLLVICQKVVIFKTVIVNLYYIFMCSVPNGETADCTSEAVDNNETVIKISAKDQCGFV